jgi:hypothetical protein
VDLLGESFDGEGLSALDGGMLCSPENVLLDRGKASSPQTMQEKHSMVVSGNDPELVVPSKVTGVGSPKEVGDPCFRKRLRFWVVGRQLCN